MRWILETTEKGNDESVWNTINKLAHDGQITVVEKGDPLESLKEQLRNMGRAIELLNSAGIDRDMMVIYLSKKSGAGMGLVRDVLFAQDEFFKKLGVKLK